MCLLRCSLYNDTWVSCNFVCSNWIWNAGSFVALAWWIVFCCCCCVYTVFMLWVKLWTGWMCCRSWSAWLCIVGVKVTPLDLFFVKWNTFTTGGHFVVFNFAFGGIMVGNTFTTDGHLMVLMCACNGIKVGNTFTTGGHFVVFRWAFGGIMVGNTFTTDGHLVVYRWGDHGAYFRKWATPVGPHQNTTLRQLLPMSKTHHGPSWLAQPCPLWQPSLGPAKANVEC